MDSMKSRRCLMLYTHILYVEQWQNDLYHWPPLCDSTWNPVQCFVPFTKECALLGLFASVEYIILFYCAFCDEKFRYSRFKFPASKQCHFVLFLTIFSCSSSCLGLIIWIYLTHLLSMRSNTHFIFAQHQTACGSSIFHVTSPNIYISRNVDVDVDVKFCYFSLWKVSSYTI